MKTTVLIWSGNWADEMDLEGLVFVAPEEADEIFSCLPLVTDEITEYIGTNEEMHWSNGAELLREIKRIDLTEEEAMASKKAMGFTQEYQNSFGIFPGSVWDAMEQIQENK